MEHVVGRPTQTPPFVGKQEGLLGHSLCTVELFQVFAAKIVRASIMQPGDCFCFFFGLEAFDSFSIVGGLGQIC